MELLDHSKNYLIFEKNKQNVYTLLQAVARPNFPTTTVWGSYFGVVF
jgi:hypothetical protein